MKILKTFEDAKLIIVDLEVNLGNQVIRKEVLQPCVHSIMEKLFP